MQFNIRLTPDEMKELKRRAAAAEKLRQREHPRTKLGVGPWMIETCLAPEADPDRREKRNGDGKKGGPAR